MTPTASAEANNYLVALVERARVDGGLTLPLVSSASLELAKQEINSGVRELDRLARQALAAGNLANAGKLVAEALHRDPGDVEALTLSSAIEKRRQTGDKAAPAAPTASGTPALPALPADPTAPATPPAPVAADKPAAAKPAAGGAGDLNLVGPPPAPEIRPRAIWPRDSCTIKGSSPKRSRPKCKTPPIKRGS